MANILLNPWQPFLSSTSFKPPKKDKMSDHGRAKAASGSRNRLESKNIVNRTSSFNYRSSSAVPLHELPWEEWRVKMTPIQVLFLTCQPVAHITAKCISEADDYPPEIPGHITKFFEIQIVSITLSDTHEAFCQSVVNTLECCLFYIPYFKIYNDVTGLFGYGPPGCSVKSNVLSLGVATTVRDIYGLIKTPKCKSGWPRHVISTYLLQTKCEFPDLNPDYMPPNFSINGKGALYLERQGRHIWMKNLLDITLNITFPPLLSWVPEYVLQNIVQSVLENYAEDINNGFAVGLLADYNSFKRNKARYSV
ncbi:hypothetical protein JHK82_035443 [Glycine max]|nr:hypothetical protein JHK85_036160 [Glycine max]KAG5112174.1 hypothetical protein JHK82_035443 [Glycine max]